MTSLLAASMRAVSCLGLRLGQRAARERAQVDDAGIAQALHVGFGEARRIDLDGVGILGQQATAGIVAAAPAGSPYPWAGPAGRAALVELPSSFSARSITPMPCQRRGHHFALEGADIGHGIGALDRGAGAEARAAERGQAEQPGAGRGESGDRRPDIIELMQRPIC